MEVDCNLKKVGPIGLIMVCSPFKTITRYLPFDVRGVFRVREIGNLVLISA